jgi:hypothetical protein
MSVIETVSFYQPIMRESKDPDGPVASVLKGRWLACRLCMNFADFSRAR